MTVPKYTGGTFILDDSPVVYTDPAKHLGPGPHPSGSDQDVHGGDGGTATTPRHLEGWLNAEGVKPFEEGCDVEECYEFTVEGRTYSVFFEKTHGWSDWENRVGESTSMDMVFEDQDGSVQVTGAGNAMQVMRKAAATILQVAAEDKPSMITFSGKGKSRADLYDFMAHRIKKLGQGYTGGTRIISDAMGGFGEWAIIRNDLLDEAENFVELHKEFTPDDKFWDELELQILEAIERYGDKQKHLGPGEHPSGSEQQVHAGDGGNSEAAHIREHAANTKLLGAFNRRMKQARIRPNLTVQEGDPILRALPDEAARMKRFITDELYKRHGEFDRGEAEAALAAMVEAEGGKNANLGDLGWDSRNPLGEPYGEISDLSNDQLIRALYERQIRSWAVSSTNSNPVSGVIHIAVAKKFGLDSDIAAMDDKTQATASQMYDRSKGVYDRIVENMYDHTQEQFELSGVDKVVVYRGMRFGKNNMPDEVEQALGGQTNIKAAFTSQHELNPVSSYSMTYMRARDFSGGAFVSMVSTSLVDRKQIFSSAITGVGSLSETELLVIGKPLQSRSIAANWTPMETDDIEAIADALAQASMPENVNDFHEAIK